MWHPWTAFAVISALLIAMSCPGTQASGSLEKLKQSIEAEVTGFKLMKQVTEYPPSTAAHIVPDRCS